MVESKHKVDDESSIKSANIHANLQPKCIKLWRVVMMSGVAICALFIVITQFFDSKAEAVFKEDAAVGQLEEVGLKSVVMFLSSPKVRQNNFSNSGPLSDLSPNLDAVEDLFSAFSVKIPTHTAPDPADPGFKKVIDSLILSYLPPMDSENGSFKLRMLREIPSGFPVQFKGVTSSFGMRIHPIHGVEKPHNGVDLRAALGSAVVSTADGVVEFTGVQKEYRARGRFIVVNHNHGFRTQYGHLQKILVKSGDFVKKGQVIGLSGKSGVTDGPHLHYQVSFLKDIKDPVHFMEWGVNNFESLFELEQGIRWSLLIDQVNAGIR
jgi:hypothetical protein